MNAAIEKAKVGKVFYFGWKKTPATIIRVCAQYPNGGIPVVLRGPRGGECAATIHPCGKIVKDRK